MTTFGQLLQQRREAILRRWLDGVLATYPEDAAAAFRRQKDPFANPVGHSLRTGTQGIFEEASDGMDVGKIHGHLLEIVKIRAVQEISASQAVGFVFQLKEAVGAELGKAAGDARFASDRMEFDRRIDRIALAAFDVYVECREKVCELRINEVKRRVSWVVDRMNRRDPVPEPARYDPE